MTKNTLNVVLILAFAMCVPVANLLIQNVGECIPNGPCLIPVGFGLSAPSGVLMIGLALVLRDVLHERMGLQWVIAAIVIGGLTSSLFSPATLAIASLAAFFVSELLDLAVYVPLRKRGFVVAAIGSSMVGLLVDSLVFLWIAFGSIDYMAGQVLGKFWAVTVAVGAISMIRRVGVKTEAKVRCWGCAAYKCSCGTHYPPP